MLSTLDQVLFEPSPKASGRKQKEWAHSNSDSGSSRRSSGCGEQIPWLQGEQTALTAPTRFVRNMVQHTETAGLDYPRQKSRAKHPRTRSSCPLKKKRHLSPLHQG